MNKSTDPDAAHLKPCPECNRPVTVGDRCNACDYRQGQKVCPALVAHHKGQEVPVAACQTCRNCSHPTCETCGHNRSYPKQSWCELWRCVFPRPHYCASHTDLEKGDV